MIKPIKCPTCGHDMDCDVYTVSALWGTLGGVARCPECGKVVRGKRIQYDTFNGVMAALRYAASHERGTHERA